MSEPQAGFDAYHPSGHLLFRSCHGGYLHSVILGEEALAAAEAYLEMKEAADIYTYKARALQAKGQSDEALAAVEKAMASLGENDNADM